MTDGKGSEDLLALVCSVIWGGVAESYETKIVGVLIKPSMSSR